MIKKDPQAKKPYFIDWSEWLGTDTIATATWDVPDGLTDSNPSIVNSGTRAVVWLEGGVAGNTYKVNLHIVTTAGLEDDASLSIYVEDN